MVKLISQTWYILYPSISVIKLILKGRRPFVMCDVTLAGVFQRKRRSWCYKCSHLYFKEHYCKWKNTTCDSLRQPPVKWNLLCHLWTGHCMWPPYLQLQQWITKWHRRQTLCILYLCNDRMKIHFQNQLNCISKSFHITSMWKVGQIKASLRSFFTGNTFCLFYICGNPGSRTPWLVTETITIQTNESSCRKTTSNQS